MPIYTVTFLGPDGSIVDRSEFDCASDDGAIDTVGESSHPYAIDLHEGERLVVRFPPWPRKY